MLEHSHNESNGERRSALDQSRAPIALHHLAIERISGQDAPVDDDTQQYQERKRDEAHDDEQRIRCEREDRAGDGKSSSDQSQSARQADRDLHTTGKRFSKFILLGFEASTHVPILHGCLVIEARDHTVDQRKKEQDHLPKTDG